MQLDGLAFAEWPSSVALCVVPPPRVKQPPLGRCQGDPQSPCGFFHGVFLKLSTLHYLAKGWSQVAHGACDDPLAFPLRVVRFRVRRPVGEFVRRQSAVGRSRLMIETSRQLRFLRSFINAK